MSLLVKPQLLETRDDVRSALAGNGGRLEPKLDGHRQIVEIDATGKARLLARSGADKTAHQPLLVAELESLLPPNTVLDGEVVSLNDEWGTVQSVLGSNPPIALAQQEQLQYAVFDVMRFDDLNAGALPYGQRRQFLENVFTEKLADAKRMRLVPSFEATQEVYERIVLGGFEGAVLKHLDAPYHPGARGAGWYRLKPNLTIDVVAMRFDEGGGKASGMLGAIRFGQYRDGVLTERGACGTGFTDELREEIWDRRDALLGQPFEARYFGCVGDPADACPRTPAFLRWRDDKQPEDCVWEVLHR